jgi:hypothetical protein
MATDFLVVILKFYLPSVSSIATPILPARRIMNTPDNIERQTVLTFNENEGEPQQSQLVAGEHDEESLLPVVDDIPFPVWLIAFVGAAERFVWYGATSPLRESFGQIDSLAGRDILISSRELHSACTLQQDSWRTGPARGDGDQYCERDDGCRLFRNYSSSGGGRRLAGSVQNDPSLSSVRPWVDCSCPRQANDRTASNSVARPFCSGPPFLALFKPVPQKAD